MNTEPILIPPQISTQQNIRGGNSANAIPDAYHDKNNNPLNNVVVPYNDNSNYLKTGGYQSPSLYNNNDSSGKNLQQPPIIPVADINPPSNNNRTLNNQSYDQREQQIKNAYNVLLNNLTASQLRDVKENLEKTIEVLSEDCALSHLVTQLPVNKIYYNISNMIWEVFDDHFKRKLPDRHERVFESFCPPCTFVKMGLYFQSIQKPLQASACIMNPSRTGETIFNLGPFIHGEATFRIDKKKHPDIHNYSETIAFPPGVIIIPDSKIITQMTDMNVNKISMGVKVCMINSEEKNVKNASIMTRFLARNPRLDCGYYTRNKRLDMKDFNRNFKRKISKKTETEADILTLAMEMEKFLLTYNPSNAQNESGSSAATSDNTTDQSSKINPDTLYIDEVDSDAVFNKDNIFQNGEPLIYNRPEDDPCDAKDIGMRVFDVSPTMISYLQNMSNIQASVEKAHAEKMQGLGILKTQGRNKFLDKDTHFLSDNRLIHHTNYDFLCFAFFNQLNHEILNALPPFNGQCILSHSNILFVNKFGECIMINDNPDTNLCTMYNNLLKLMESSNIQNKFISTASNTNLTFNGMVPKAKISNQQIAETYQALMKADEQKDIPQQDKKMYRDFLKDNALLFRETHNKIKNSADVFKHYFCWLKDDVGEDIEFKDNEVAFDTARKIYPEIVLESGKNKRHVSLDFSVKTNDRAVIDQSTPNIVYIKNLGYVTLTNICNGAPLILKNAAVLLQNLMNRYTKKKHAIISTATDCRKRKPGDENYSDDDLDDVPMPKAQIVVTMPEKTKILPGAVNLYGEESDLDHLGHVKRIHCTHPQVTETIRKFSRYDDSNPCMRGI